MERLSLPDVPGAPVPSTATAVELIDWVVSRYPLTSPALDETERYIFWKAGQQELIRVLLDVKQQILNPPAPPEQEDPKAYYTSDNYADR